MKSFVAFVFVLTLVTGVLGRRGGDRYPDCRGWADRGDCQANAEWMWDFCPAACEDAPTVPFAESKDCPGWAARGECQSNPGYMLTYCANACAETPSGPEECEDLDQFCAGFAANRECERNPGYMLDNCRKSCRVCGGDAQPRNDNSNDEEVDTNDSSSEDIDETAQMKGTSISALIGNLLPKAEKKNLFKEQQKN